MNILSNKAVKQLVDSMDQSIVLDMIGVQVAKLYQAGNDVTTIEEMVTPALREYGYTATTVPAYVQAHLSDSVTKFDGYGPEGLEQDTGFLYQTVSSTKNSSGKIVRTISVGFSSVTGQPQNYNVPKKVTVTEIS